MGALWLKAGNAAEADSVLQRGLAKDPYCYACHLGLGELYLSTGQFPLARQHLQWVVRFFPDSDVTVFRSLIAADLLLKDMQSARAVLRKGLRLFPDDAALLKAEADLGR